MNELGDGRRRRRRNTRRVNQAALRNGTRRLIGVMNNRLHGFVSGIACPALVLHKRNQNLHATSPFGCSKPLALPQLNLAVTLSPKNATANCTLLARGQHAFCFDFHKLCRPQSIHCSKCMPCDTAVLADLTCIRSLVELAITPHVQPLITLLLTLPLSLYRASSHVSQDRSDATRDPRTTPRRTPWKITSSMPLGWPFKSCSCCVFPQPARLGSQCPANDANDLRQLLLPITHKTPEENQTSESRLSKPQCARNHFNERIISTKWLMQ